MIPIFNNAFFLYSLYWKLAKNQLARGIVSSNNAKQPTALLTTELSIHGEKATDWKSKGSRRTDGHQWKMRMERIP